MSTQRKEILQVMTNDRAWTWTYDELGAALPHIAANTLRKQVSRLVATGDVVRCDAGSFRLPAASSASTSDTPRDERDTGVPATGEHAQNAHTRPPPSVDAPARPPADASAGTPAHNAPGRADAGGRPLEHAPAPQLASDRDATRSRPLTETRAYTEVLDALPVAPLRAMFRVASALAFVRSQLRDDDCEAPAVAIAGAAGTGKTVLFKALSILLHGDTDAIADARTLTSSQQIIGRRERKDGAYTAIPSVLLEPPDKPNPAVVVLDEIGEAKRDVLNGASLLLRLEPHYALEDVKMPIRAVLGFTWNKPNATRGAWHPWTGWEGATRRMLVCDVDYAARELKQGAAKTAARRVFGALEHAPRIDLSQYRAVVRYPSVAMLEQFDTILKDIFNDPSELPLGDPVLRGLGAAYGALFGLDTERALLFALGDVATVVGTLPRLLTPDAEKRLNERLRAASLPTVALPRVEDVAVADDDTVNLSPAARERIARHLAMASVKGTDELLTILSEYGLARRVWRPVRAPRYCLEFCLRWTAAGAVAIAASLHNVAIAPYLKLPRVSGGFIAGVFGAAVRGPRTQLRTWTTHDGEPLERPRAYVLKLFGDHMDARAVIGVEDAAATVDGVARAA